MGIKVGWGNWWGCNTGVINIEKIILWYAASLWMHIAHMTYGIPILLEDDLRGLED